MKLDRLIAVRNNKTVYRDGSSCIKVFNQDYSKADVLNEALNQARIEETDLAIPRILEVTMVEGKWAIVSEYIEGKTLARLMEEDPAQKEAYITLLVELQMKVHDTASPLLNKLKDKMMRQIAQTDLDATTRYDLHNRLETMPRHNKVCHGDFNPSNIILTRDGTPYILDWSQATQGNASADVARTYLLFGLQGDKEGGAFYLDTFCQKSGTEKLYVQKWMPFVAAAHSVAGNSHEREYLMKWVNGTLCP